jgi:hypothetical protein
VVTLDPIFISKMLTDEFTIKILTAAYKENVSAYDLCRMFDIPVMRCFSLVKQLENAGLLVPAATVPQSNGNIRTYYRSKVRAVTITIENGKLAIKMDWDGQKNSSFDTVDVMDNKLDILDL